MAEDGVKLIKPGMKYEGAQGVTYDAGAYQEIRQGLRRFV